MAQERPQARGRAPGDAASSRHVSIPAAKISVPVDCPRWWNEGMASVFEYWDPDKTVDENFAAIPNRGRYAPVIRLLHGTKTGKTSTTSGRSTGPSWACRHDRRSGHVELR